MAFLSDWQKTICKVLYPSLNHYSLPKLKVTSYRKYMRGAKVMTYFSTYLMPVFCKNKRNNPSLIVYTYYIVLTYTTYIFWIQMPQISTGLIGHSEAYSPLNWMVREVPGSIPSTAAGRSLVRSPPPPPRRDLSKNWGNFFLISKGSGYACLS